MFLPELKSPHVDGILDDLPVGAVTDEREDSTTAYTVKREK